jgi:hypothetical protein
MSDKPATIAMLLKVLLPWDLLTIRTMEGVNEQPNPEPL